MDIDQPPARSSYFSGCMASPSWFPAYRDPSRFHLLRREAGRLERSRNWRNVLKRLLKEGKSVYCCSSKPVTFGYDAVSYSKNFDDGCSLHAEASRRVESAGLSSRTSVCQSF